MTIAVAYKVAANPQDARVEPDGRIDWSRGKLGISDYDPVAIQVAREAADVSGTELVGVSVGTVAATAAKEKKNVLARGLDRVMTLGDDKTSEWSSVQVAGALAALIQRIGGVTLVVTGDASVDEGAQLMPALVGARLGFPTFLEVTHVEPSGTGWQITQNYDGGSRVVRTDGAAVIATTPDATTPKAPGMKDILKAAKKPIEDVKCSELDLSRATVNVVSRGPAPVKERKHQVFRGEGPGAQTVGAPPAAWVI